MILDIYCEICFERIATADTEGLSLPITGAMFGSPDQLHGVPAPFPAEVSWEFMRCPYGNHRPIIEEAKIPHVPECGNPREPEHFLIQPKVEIQESSEITKSTKRKSVKDRILEDGDAS
jgi:hypothetical protein